MGEGGTLGVFSLGFLRQPALRSALGLAGWRVVPGFGSCDAIGVWGRRPVSARGLGAAAKRGKPVITIEDGFIRSVLPGRGAPILSLTLDDLGVHYDASAPSRLERLIQEAQGDRARAHAAMARLRSLGISKYNTAPRLTDPPKGHILVVDQTVGDASIGDAAAFARMLAAAKAEHPGEQILIRRHPETISGHKAGHFSDTHVSKNVSFCDRPANPWDLIEGARAVYTVSSQLGFEALMAGCAVRCFGQPFYAGWGVTGDEIPIPRRKERRSVTEIFDAAYLRYPVYFDPWRGKLSHFEEALEALALFRDRAERNRVPAVCAGIRLWKRGHVARFLGGAGRAPKFEDDPARAEKIAVEEGRRLIWWAPRAPAGAAGARMEDGFLRSSGLGAELVAPLSLSVDETGIYYDPERPSRLERLIETAPSDAPSLARAARLRSELVRLGVTKYNLQCSEQAALQRVIQRAGRRVILVPGQVEDDASIRTGAGEIRTNLALLKAVRAAAPDACILYKPHPDVEAGLRAGAVDAALCAALADGVARQTAAKEALALADEVWTMTSLMGFEALLRGKTVVTFGAPFYAGWGLTDDRGTVPERRKARPALDQLVHAALIDYPEYLDPVSGLAAPPEVIVERLAAGVQGGGPGVRLLAKAQGLFASYASLWR